LRYCAKKPTLSRRSVPDNIAVDPFMAEALGIRWAIQFVHAQGLQYVSIFF
jgi:hypothetical protein